MTINTQVVLEKLDMFPTPNRAFLIRRIIQENPDIRGIIIDSVIFMITEL